MNPKIRDDIATVCIALLYFLCVVVFVCVAIANAKEANSSVSDSVKAPVIVPL